jgi:hypothetical protein
MRERQRFERWLTSQGSDPQPDTRFVSSQFHHEYIKRRSGLEAGWVDELLGDCQRTIESERSLFGQFTGMPDTNAIKLGPATRPERTNVSDLTIDNCNTTIELENLTARRLSFGGNNKNIRLKNLWVDSLTFFGKQGTCILEDVWVGDLIFIRQSAFEAFNLTEGGILNIQCNTPDGDNPIAGSATFKKIYFPRKVGLRLKGPQPYRNMRSHMERLQNVPAASLFFALEQTVDRKSIHLFSLDRLISWIYSLLSNYGTSVQRPFWAFVFLLILSSVLVYEFDGALIAEPADLHGWQVSMLGDGIGAQLTRAVTLVGQATLNPLGVFGQRGLLIANSGPLEIWLIAHGIYSILFLALFLLALRRRFKMP